MGSSAFYLAGSKRQLNEPRNFNLPQLTGPETLCFAFGGKSVLGTFSGGGIPETDVYTWKIFGPSGDQISQTLTGGALLQSINFTFSNPGVHRVELQVKRGVIEFPTQTLNVRIQERPTPTLNPSYSLCGTDPLNLQAISPTTPFFGDYEFEWTSSAGAVLSTTNTLTVTQPGVYSVAVFIPNSSGDKECSSVFTTQIKDSNNTEIESLADSFCSNQGLTFTTNPSSRGKWFLKKSGGATEYLVNPNASSIILNPIDMVEGFGNYEVIFEVINPDAVNCLIRKTKTISYNPQPDFELLDPIPSSGCENADGGIVIRALTDIDYLIIENTNISTPPLKAGDTYTIPGIESGAYNLISILGNCDNSYASVVPLGNLPPELDYDIEEITGETCTTDGRLDGSFLVNIKNGPTDGYYNILTDKGDLVALESFSNKKELLITLPGGNYVFELSNQDSCSFAKEEKIEIPGKLLVDYFVPEEIFICQSGELTPTSPNPNLEYEVISPSGVSQSNPSNVPFTLTEAGEHKIIGRDPTDDLFCPVSKFFTVNLVDPVEFEVVLLEEDCQGNRTFGADIKGRDPNSVIFTWFNEKEEIVGNGQFLNPISTGEFKLDVQPANSSACPIPPKPFLVRDPILTMEVDLSATQLCELGPKAIITADFEFPDEATDWNWRRFETSGVIIELPEFKNRLEIEVDEPGVYELAVFSIIPEINKNCELGRKSIQIDLNLDRVSFEVPDQVTFCEETLIFPQSNQPLKFEITNPDGSIQSINSGESFKLSSNGEYVVYGFDPSPNPVLCPEQKIIQATRTEKIEFNPEFISQDCQGISYYSANIGSLLSEDVEIFWTNSAGDTLGTAIDFSTGTPGIYFLDVHPANSLPCDQDPKMFEIEAPILTLEVDIEAETLCPDQPDAALSLVTNMNQVKRIEWWYTDLSNNQSELVNNRDKSEILATSEGTYEVRVFNEFDCFLGADETIVIRSTDQNRPILEESYLICPRLDLGPTLNPGSFATYEWYFGDRLVSNNPTYKPDQIGTYYLIVYSNEGCAYETSFETLEECELRVSFPNAIQPGNPDKGFLIYSNYLIDELEVWILNKWGNEVFQCKNFDLNEGEATCIWDGYYRGEKVIPGTYAVKISYRNLEKGIQEEKFASILVVD